MKERFVKADVIRAYCWFCRCRFRFRFRDRCRSRGLLRLCRLCLPTADPSSHAPSDARHILGKAEDQSFISLSPPPPLVLTLTVGAGLSEELLMLPFSHMFLMLRVPPVGISATVDLGDFTSLFPCGNERMTKTFRAVFKVAFQRKTLPDRSPEWLMRTGPFCCQSWRRWGCGTLWVCCCIDEDMWDISAMMHKCPVHLSKLIIHLFWVDLFKNPAFSPICTKKKESGYKSLSITCQISPGQVVPDQHPRWPHWRADQAVHEDACLYLDILLVSWVNWSVWLLASQQLHKQLKMNCTSHADAERITLDLIPKIVQGDMYGVVLVFDEGHIWLGPSTNAHFCPCQPTFYG